MRRTRIFLAGALLLSLLGAAGAARAADPFYTGMLRDGIMAYERKDYAAAARDLRKGGADAGPIGELPQRARFHWLVAPRSTVIQMSPVHSGVCSDPREALDKVFDRMVAVRSA